MWPFHRHDWIIVKTMKMIRTVDAVRKGELTRVWYMCERCKKAVVVDRHSHLELEEIESIFPTPKGPTC